MNTTPPIPWTEFPIDIPIAWTEFPIDCLIYLVLVGVLHLAVFAVGCLAAVLFSWWQPGTLRRRIGHFALFLGLLLVVGSVFNGLWCLLIYNRLYHSVDLILGFVPFWPIWWITVDTPWGDGSGRLFTSLFVLKLVWLLFAVGTWAVTIFLYQIIRRRLSPNHSNAARPAMASRCAALALLGRFAGWKR